MKIILSRKGFDSASGGGPSPIINGRPVSLPIPAGAYPSETTYGDLGLGAEAKAASNGKVEAKDHCHYDPMFENDRCAFGQAGQMQEGHLRNQCVGEDDVFLFFGWFANEKEGDHHRIFGYLKVEEVHFLGANPGENSQPAGFSERHPHTIPHECWGREEKEHNTLYVGEGCAANTAHPFLRLTEPGNPKRSVWRVPGWLRDTDLSYHADDSRWKVFGDKEFMRLQTVGRGQDFVADLSKLSDADRKKARLWLDEILAAIKTPPHPE